MKTNDKPKEEMKINAGEPELVPVDRLSGI